MIYSLPRREQALFALKRIIIGKAPPVNKHRRPLVENLGFPQSGKLPFLDCGKFGSWIFHIGEILIRTADKTEKRKFSPAKTFSEGPKWAVLLPKNTGFDGGFYLSYNQRKILVLKTRWKKWKTTWKTPDFSQKGSGKPGGKS